MYLYATIVYMCLLNSLRPSDAISSADNSFEECERWRHRFSHLRVLGACLLPPTSSLASVGDSAGAALLRPAGLPLGVGAGAGPSSQASSRNLSTRSSPNSTLVSTPGARYSAPPGARCWLERGPGPSTICSIFT